MQLDFHVRLGHLLLKLAVADAGGGDPAVRREVTADRKEAATQALGLRSH
jgi:hypothetical protein